MTDRQLLKFVADQLPMLPHIHAALEQLADKVERLEAALAAEKNAPKPVDAKGK